MRNAIFFTVFVVGLVVGTVSISLLRQSDASAWREHAQALLSSSMPAKPQLSPNAELSWPPRLGEPYPDLTLRDLNGESIKLSAFKGQAFILEPVGVTCRGCQAFAGGQSVGGFQGLEPQPGLESFPAYFQQFAGQRFEDAPLLLIQVVFYGSHGQAPTLREVQAWERHFAPVAPHNSIVLFADQAMIQPSTRSMIPGFQLVDQDFNLVCDAGNPPRQSLYADLIPAAKRLLGSATERDPRVGQ